MQLARQPCPFVLLRRNEPPAHLPSLIFGPASVRDIDAHTQHADRLAFIIQFSPALGRHPPLNAARQEQAVFDRVRVSSRQRSSKSLLQGGTVSEVNPPLNVLDLYRFVQTEPE